MKQFFRATQFKESSLALVEQCNDIIEEYLGQNLRLTLRQLYYQLVSRNVIPNVERSYKNLSTLVSNARLAGMMDWEAIEDRVRQPVMQTEFENLDELVDAALSSYRLPRWRGQDTYAELWVEKDALAGVLRPIAREYHVTLMVNRGVLVAERDVRERQALHRRGRPRARALFYLGDHDPSGEDMVRDIRDRMEMFGVEDLNVQKLALTMDQIDEYDPPPNPAKVTDPRAAAYIAEHGDSSWEVDALPPNVLAEIIRTALGDVVEQDALDEVLEQEKNDKDQLREALQSLRST